MTIYQIKKETAKTNPYFFSKDTMKFFGQTLKDFKVKKISDNRFYIYADGEFGRTERIYDDCTKELLMVQQVNWDMQQAEFTGKTIPTN